MLTPYGNSIPASEADGLPAVQTTLLTTAACAAEANVCVFW
jgi:hypothetical protein